MESVLQVCQKALAWAENQSYTGYDKSDALNSPFLYRLAANSRYLRGGFVYLFDRAPINLRPLFGVKKRQNPKSLALFARSYFNLFDCTDDKALIGKGVHLLEALLELSQIRQYSGHCWGTQYPRQSTKFFAESYIPSTVVTVEVAEAFLDAYEKTGETKYLDVANSAAEFVLHDLYVLEDGAEGLCYSYIPGSSWKVINANAKTASFFARLSTITGNESLRDKAQANMHWVVGRQTDYGAWYYADPPQASHVRHDNYHTGFILDSLINYMMVTGDKTWLEIYDSGLAFYEKELFLPNGAPKWRSDRVYPLDIHGAAQGILNFGLASFLFPEKWAVAQKITGWTLATMYSSEGRFYYQKGPFLTKRYTLMRWCQSWMCYGLSVFLYREPARWNVQDYDKIR